MTDKHKDWLWKLITSFSAGAAGTTTVGFIAPNEINFAHPIRCIVIMGALGLANMFHYIAQAKSPWADDGITASASSLFVSQGAVVRAVEQQQKEKS